MSDAYVPAFVKEYREKAKQDPENPLSWYDRAQEYRESGDLQAWHRAIDVVLTMPHDSPVQRWYRAWARIARGDWSGWTDYEARTAYADEVSPRTTMDDWVRWTHDAWDGTEDLSDKTILVLPEQGMGDNIQMLRFLAPLADRAKAVVASVYPRLVPFVQCNVDDRVTVMIRGVDKPFAFDRYARAMSLPHLLGQLPPFLPFQPPGRRPRLSIRTRPIRAGICWAGNPDYGNDARRSMVARYIAPLVARPDIEWFNLQVGARAINADQYPALVRPWPPLVHFGDTADLIAELDVVVAVDTAVGHLAGCLGVPTYLLLPTVADARWGLGDSTPWYPSVRLVRQSTPDDWTEVVHRLQRMIDQFVMTRDDSSATHDGNPEARVLSATY